MSMQLDEQIRQLKQTIAEMESQRGVLGDEAVDRALIPFQEKLGELELQSAVAVEDLPDFPERQRKLVTLLFMDVVGSTAMTQHLDPEDTLDIMDAALRRLAAPVEAHRGHVSRFMGDGFKAVFGDPTAREDDPEQAIRAGLEMLEETASLAQELKTQWEIEDFNIRIGINTGLVALGGYTESGDTIMGAPVNLAARIESAALPGGLLISHDTYRHVRGVFSIEIQEPITAKGFPDPVSVYLVKGVKPRSFRVQTRGVEGVETRMVGRQTELIYLQDALLTAIEEGEGQTITITGEAGVGKSRLLYEFQNWFELLPDSVFLFQGRGRQEAQGQPYSLLRDLFVFRFRILDDDTGREARRKIEAGFGDVFGVEQDAMMRTHIIGQLLGFDFSTSKHLRGVINDPEQLRNRGLMYLKEYFRTFSQESPIVIFLEDIHWGDDSSLGLVNNLGEYTAKQPWLMVCTARPYLYEIRPYWGEGQTHHGRLELHPLSKRESRQLVEEVLKLVEEIPPELRELVVGSAEGNPFYLEELIKMLIEDGVIIPDEETWHIEPGYLAKAEVPSTLAGVLQARLDRLPSNERIVLQQASVVGRLFWDRLLAHIQAKGRQDDNAELVSLALTSLRSRELIYRREDSAFSGALEYLFKHDVLRQVTYQSVIKRLRKNYHGLVADWLIENSSDRISEYNGLIAEHLLSAGRKEQACSYYASAGQSALASYASSEAEDYYRRALDLSPSEILRSDVFAGLGEAMFRQGRSEEAIEMWRQAIDLYHDLENSDRLADVYARFSILLWNIDYLKAWELCQEGLALLEGAPDSPGYARLLAEAGRTAAFRNVTDQIIPLCQKALDMAARVGDVEVQAGASITLAFYQEMVEDRIGILEEVIQLTEANGLLRTASRAHFTLAFQLENFLIDLNSAHQHNLRAAEYARQIGDTELMMFVLNNVSADYIWLGKMNTVEEQLVEFFRESSAPETRVKDFFEDYRHNLLGARGEWMGALEKYREIRIKLQQGGSIQPLAINNIWLVVMILNLHQFGYLDDLSEAENAMEENIEVEWNVLESNFLLVIVYIRQGRNSESRALLKNIKESFSQQDNNDYKVYHSNAKYELARAEGRWEDAIEACKNSIGIYKNCGHRWYWARKLIDLGDVLVNRKESGDIERARETYKQSLDMFTEMGATGYIQVLKERLESLDN